MALTLGDNFSYQGAKPLDARLKYDTLAAMKSVADATMYDGCMAYCVATDKTYQWKSTNTVDADTGKWREFSSGSGDTIQVDTLPTAGADELGKVYQYIGSTTLTLTHGYFYECVSDGAGTPTYSWENVPTSKGGHDIKNDGVAVTARDTMNFTDFDIADDSTNLETDIKAHRLTQAEMSEIMSTLPGTPTELPVLIDLRNVEHVVGWYVLANGTKKPVYEKTCDMGSAKSLTNSQWMNTGVSYSGLNIEAILGSVGWNIDTSVVDSICIPLMISTYVNSGYFHIQEGRNQNATAIRYFSVRYTKTTDTPV